MRLLLIRRLATPTLLAAALPAQSYDINDKLSVSGLLAATGQCQNLSALLPGGTYGEVLDDTVDPPLLDGTLDAIGNECRGGMPFQVEVDFRPDESNEFFLKLGFAADNGLNTVSPWVLAPWAADLQDDVQDINGSGRDYLLAAWYKHTFTFSNESTLGASFGILDSTSYLDGNAYANDEYTQFMNEVFVNSGSYGLPSYAPGAALEWSSGPWSLNATGMNIAENDDGNSFNFWGVEAGYQAETPLGTGNYRLILAGASSAFLDPTGTRKESRLAWGLSFDQALGEVLGVFLRTAWQEEDAAVDYKALYSGGINLNGSGWGREPDNIGIGYAYVDGGNLDIESSQVLEAYYRFGVNDYLGITADLQYMSDDRAELDPLQENPDGWIFGLRLTAAF
jgi:porin